MAGSYTRRIQLYINGKEVNNDIRSIKNEMNKLINEQARMTRGSKEYLEAGAKIRTLKGIIQEHNDQLKTTSRGWFNLKAMAENMNRYFILFGSFVAGLTGIITGGKRAITTFAEFDDKVSDVMKTTQLGKDAVMGMNEEFKKMDTRTAQLELLDLARAGGKLGLTKEKDVEGFVKATDKISVALKEDLGGNAEEAVNEIGKLVDIFKVKEKYGIEESLLKTGSAINALGAASTANEGYIVEFTKRVAGVAPQAKISIQNVMGLAATLDSLGQTSEVSSTVYSAVITGMFQDTETYSKIAGMSVKAFSNLLKKDANEAFIKLLEGLNGNGAGMEELTQKMDGLGLEGKRSIAVLGVLAGNTKTLRDQQKLSNDEFNKGTSILNEFNTKNNNAQANLEKKKKELYNLTVDLGQKLMPVLTMSTSGFSYFVKSVSITTDWFIRNSRAIITTTSAIAAYTVATKLATLWQQRSTAGTIANTIVTKAKTLATEGAFAATQLLAAAEMLLTGNIKGATQAMRVFTATTRLNPIGLLVGLITVAAGAFMAFRDKADDAKSSNEDFLESLKTHTDSVIKEKNEVNSLIRHIITLNEKSEYRKKLISELQEKYPDFLKNINTEKVSNAQLLLVLERVNSSYQQRLKLAGIKAREEAIEKKIVDNESRKLEIEEQLEELRKKATTAGSSDDRLAKALESEYNTLAGKNKELSNQLDALSKKESSLQESMDTTSLEALKKQKAQIESGIKTTESQLATAKDKQLQDKIDFYTGQLKQYNLQSKLLDEQIKNAKAAQTQKEPAAGDGFTPADKNKKKYSLTDDLKYTRELYRLKNRFLDGEIKTEEEYNRQKLDLDIKYLDLRIKAHKDKEEDLIDIQQDFADKKLEKKKAEDKRLDALTEASTAADNELQKEKGSYEKKLKELDLYGKTKEQMTALELKAYESLTSEHLKKLDKLDADAIKAEIERKQQAFESGLQDLRMKNADELSEITSLEQAKSLLAGTMSSDELNKIKTLEQAKKALKKKYQSEEEKFTREHLQEILTQLQQVVNTGNMPGIDLSNKLLSEEEKKILIDRINEIKKTMGGLRNESGSDNKTQQELDKEARLENASAFHTEQKKIDILGFTQDDWLALFDNLESGKVGVNEISLAVSSLIEAWGMYNKFLSINENKQLKNYEKTNNERKKTLQRQLERGVISQEAYNSKVEALDTELDAKKEEISIRQAKREKALAIASIIQNTAASLIQLWVKPGFPMAIPLSILVGGIGAFQLATAMATEIPGAETGGFIDVLRSQDGKPFNAKFDPRKRGFVSGPTVIVGEKPNSSEYVVSDAGVNNPTIRPVLDILEMARQNGNLAQINLPAIMNSMNLGRVSGRETGGYFDMEKMANKSFLFSGENKVPDNNDVIEKMYQVLQMLNQRLEKPIKADVSLRGRNGIYEMMEEDNQLKNNTIL